jgi:hypothetical protein
MVEVEVDIALMLTGLAWLAILAMLVWGVCVEILRLMRGPEKAPFFGILDRHGLTLLQAEQAAGVRGVGAAASRCASCGVREACRRALRWGRLGFTAPPCPNDSFFAQVAEGSKPWALH